MIWWGKCLVIKFLEKQKFLIPQTTNKKIEKWNKSFSLSSLFDLWLFFEKTFRNQLLWIKHNVSHQLGVFKNDVFFRTPCKKYPLTPTRRTPSSRPITGTPIHHHRFGVRNKNITVVRSKALLQLRRVHSMVDLSPVSREMS